MSIGTDFPTNFPFLKKLLLLVALWMSLPQLAAQIHLQGDAELFAPSEVHSPSETDVFTPSSVSVNLQRSKIFVVKGALVSNLPETVEVVYVDLPLPKEKKFLAKKEKQEKTEPLKDDIRILPSPKNTFHYSSAESQQIGTQVGLAKSGIVSLLNLNKKNLATFSWKETKWMVYALSKRKTPSLRSDRVIHCFLASSRVRPPPVNRISFSENFFSGCTSQNKFQI